MPIREYECKNCGIFEEIHKTTEERLTTCPKCGNMLKLLLSSCNSIFRGSGFYVTDYQRKKSKEKKEEK